MVVLKLILVSTLLVPISAIAQPADSLYSKGMYKLLSDYDLSGAQVQFERTIKADTNHSDAYYQLGLVCELKNDYKAAEYWYNRYLDHDSSLANAGSARKHLAVVKLLQSPSCPDSLKMLVAYAKTVYKAGILMYNGDSIAVAYEELEAQRMLLPSLPDAYVIEATMYDIIERYNEGIALLDSAIANCPGNRQIFGRLRNSFVNKRDIKSNVEVGKKYLRNKEYHRAEMAFKIANTLMNDSVIAPINTATKRIDSAFDQYQNHTTEHEVLRGMISSTDSRIVFSAQEIRMYFIIARCYRVSCPDLQVDFGEYLNSKDERIRAIAWNLYNTYTGAK